MARFWGRVAGSWTARAAIVVVVALIAGFIMAQQTGGGPGASPLASGMSAAAVTRVERSVAPARALRTRGGGVLEIRLDDLLEPAGTGRIAVVDREALWRFIRATLGGDGPVEEIRFGDVLDRFPRVRVVSEGNSFVLGRRALTGIAERVAGGSGASVEDLTLGELMDAMPDVRLGPDGTPEGLDQGTMALLSSIFGSVRRIDHSRDPRWRERVDLEAQYDVVVRLVNQLRLEGFLGPDKRETLYDEAYRRLLAAGEDTALPLLEAHLQLESELAGAEMSGMDRADRIAYRWEARRNAFGEETAKLLFGRQEAMERYQIERLAIESDDYVEPAERARRLSEVRTRLKVDLAAQGSYVGFPDEASSAPAVGGDVAPKAGSRVRSER